MGFLEVIRTENLKSDWIVYKVLGHEVNRKSKLIVGVGEVAIVVHGGKVEHIFESGTYTLNGENLPFVNGLTKSVYSGNSPYSIEVYFFNKTIKLDILWGTNDPIQLIDPKYGVKVRVRARGQFGIRMTDYQLVFTQLIGTLSGNTVINFNIIRDYFRSLINTKVKTLLSEYIIKNKVSLMDINMYLEQLSIQIKNNLDDEIYKFGFDLINFYFESINIPDEDMDQINNLLTKKAEFDIIGDERYSKSRGFDVLEKAAENGNNSFVGAGVGIGAGVTLGAGMAKVIKDENLMGSMSANNLSCTKCGSKLPENAKFCHDCGERVVRVCPQCSIKINPGTKFCPECGFKIGE